LILILKKAMGTRDLVVIKTNPCVDTSVRRLIISPLKLFVHMFNTDT